MHAKRVLIVKKKKSNQLQMAQKQVESHQNGSIRLILWLMIRSGGRGGRAKGYGRAYSIALLE